MVVETFLRLLLPFEVGGFMAGESMELTPRFFVLCEVLVRAGDEIGAGWR